MKLTVDDQKRVTLPQAHPGDVFEVREDGGDKFVLTRVTTQFPKKKMTREEVEEGLKKWTAKADMTWEELRAWTREP